MVVLHDLPEGLTTDIPAPTWQLFPSGVKNDVERLTMQTIFGDMPLKQNLLVYWEELHENETVEARLVHDCDKLDMYLQAFMYEQQTGNRQLAEFWNQDYSFEFAETKAIFDELSSLRLLGIA